MAGSKLTAKEQENLNRAITGEITNAHAAKQLRLSIRQVQRAKIRLRLNGSVGIVHKLKGKPSNHQLDDSLKEKTLKLVKEKYTDFKPTFAAEILQEIHSLTINPQTLRRWMVGAGLWKERKEKHKSEHRSWRSKIGRAHV